MSGEPPLTVLPAASQVLLDAMTAVLATPGLPPVALIGGLAVAMRVTASGTAHRATVDIDLVTISTDLRPEAIELLALAHHSEQHPLIVEGIKVDLIPTSPLTDADLDGLGDHDRLFLAGHRWAFEGAQAARLRARNSATVSIRVATPAGLVAAKSHAVGFPSIARRSTKHGSDLLDIFRLVDLCNVDGSLVAELRSGPAELPRIIADVTEREILANPAMATNRMGSASPIPIDRDRVIDTLDQFVQDLRT